MKNLWLTILALILFVALALVFIYLLRDIVFQSSTVLTSTECEPPCWNGIRPGETTLTDVSNVLRHIEGVDQQSITANSPITGGDAESISWFFEPPLRDLSGTAYFENEIVTAISLLTVNSLKLEDVFDHFGEPELVWAEIAPSSYQESVELCLIYLEKGLLIKSMIETKSPR